MSRPDCTHSSSRRRHLVRPLLSESLEDRHLLTSFMALPEFSTVTDVSADGSVVFGQDSRGAFRWTASGGVSRLSDTSPVIGFDPDVAQDGGISGDGKVLVGTSKDVGYGRLASWTAAGGTTDLGVDIGVSSPLANGVSADGSVIVGRRSSASPQSTFAFYWTSRTGPQPLADASAGYKYSNATDVAADGKVIVGAANTATTQQPFRWDASTGAVLLGFQGAATAISADGSTIVGQKNDFTTKMAFAWTSAGEQDLAAPAGTTSSYAADVSADGKRVVGSASISNLALQTTAVIWDDAGQPAVLSDLLTTKYGLNLTGWNLQTAIAISADGTTIIGEGRNPDGVPTPWVANLVIPPNLTATSLTLDPSYSGVTYSAALTGGDLASPATVGLYWGFTDNYGKVRPIGSAITTTTLQQAGSTGPIFVPRSTLTSPPAGADSLTVVADPSGAVVESYKGDNSQSVALPDIQAQVAWDILQVAAKARNRVIGASLTADTTMGFYWASGPTKADILGAALATQVIPAGSVGTSADVVLHASDLASPPAGAKYLLAVVDPSDVILESNETNNVAVLPVPDLAPTSLTMDASGNVQYSGRMSTTSTPIFSGNLDLYYATGPSASDILPGAIDRQYLASQKDYGPYTVSWVTLTTRPANATYLVLIADSTNMVIESDETNNVLSIPLPPIVVLNNPPHVVMTSSPIIGPVNSQATITGSFTDGTSTSWTATIDRGDGAGPVPLALNPDHTFSAPVSYATPGIYNITITVTDDGGLSDAASTAAVIAGPGGGGGSGGGGGTTKPVAKLVGPVANLKKGALTGVTLSFDQAIANLSGATFSLVQAGRDRKFGTKDDMRIILKPVSASSNSVTISLKKAAKLAKAARLTVTNLKAADGRGVDADGDGIPDVTWFRTLSPANRGKSVIIT